MKADDAREMLAALLPRLRRLAAALTGSLRIGDELVAATLRRTLDSLERWPEGMRFDSWVFSILHGLSETTEWRLPRGENLDWEPGDRMILHNARVAIAALPERQRLALALVNVEGLSHGEAARTLEVPRSDLVADLARARAGLAEALDLGLEARPKGEGLAAVPDDLLIAANDGELPPRRQTEVKREIEASTVARRRSQALQEAGRLAEEAFQDILQEDLPPWLEAELAEEAVEEFPPEALWSAAPRRRQRVGPAGKRLTAVLAITAALLVIGVVAVAAPLSGN